MAQFHKPTPKPSCFPSFSRSSGKKYSEDPPPHSRKRRSTGCFSWLRFRVKKLPAKTVPMDSALQEKANGADQIQMEKLPPAGQNSSGCHGAPVASEKAAKVGYSSPYIVFWKTWFVNPLSKPLNSWTLQLSSNSHGWNTSFCFLFLFLFLLLLLRLSQGAEQPKTSPSRTGNT